MVLIKLYTMTNSEIIVKNVNCLNKSTLYEMFNCIGRSKSLNISYKVKTYVRN